MSNLNLERMSRADLVQKLEDLANECEPESDEESKIPTPVDAEDIVDLQDNYNLIKLFTRMRDATVTTERGDWVLEECKLLFKRDYECKFVDNLDNKIPGVHPKLLFIPVAELTDEGQGIRKHFDAIEYLMQEQDSNYIHVTRFPCPVILYNGKYICRSRYPSILKARRYEQTAEASSSSALPRSLCNPLKLVRMMGEIKKDNFARMDAKFLRSLDVPHIIDLTISTECNFLDDIMGSENLRNIYQHIDITSMPFPGPINFASTLAAMELAKKYLLAILEKLVGGRGGLLFQSFTGRYRNSLFTSLLRLSLWADGVIHKNLDTREITFLTLGYDWYFFGYQINDRQDVFKEMMALFYSFLPVISTNEFSITRVIERHHGANQASSVLPRFPPSRRQHLTEISNIIWRSFNAAYQYCTSFDEKSKHKDT